MFNADSSPIVFQLQATKFLSAQVPVVTVQYKICHKVLVVVTLVATTVVIVVAAAAAAAAAVVVAGIMLQYSSVVRY